MEKYLAKDKLFVADHRNNQIIQNFNKNKKIIALTNHSLPFKLFLDPVSRGSGKLETLISGKCAHPAVAPSHVAAPHPVPVTWPTLRGLADLWRGPRRSTRTRANSTERRSSTATIMSLTIVTSSPCKERRPNQAQKTC